MQCEYIGNFNESHNAFKKRRMIGPAKEKAISSIFGEGLSCETYREREAERLIKEGHYSLCHLFNFFKFKIYKYYTSFIKNIYL